MVKELEIKAGIKSRKIEVDYLARVEGEGALYIDVDKGLVKDVKLKIFEPPRFFEAFMQGRSLREAPDITARICGICPVAYQMSSVHALEGILGIKVSEAIRRLRRLLYCGEWIESHVLHVYMLHAPDFFGFDDALAMAAQHGPAVQRGLRMKKIGNEIVRVLGGREIHPINVRVGGFYKIPEKERLTALLDELKWGRDAAAETVHWTTTFDFPELRRDYEFVSVVHPDEYPMNEGRVVSSNGINIPVSDYDDTFEEVHVEHANALQAVRSDTQTPYFVGPMARFNLARDRLSDSTQELMRDVGFDRHVDNPFESIVVRAIETYYAFDEAIRLIEDFVEPEQAFIEPRNRAGVGMAATEAPRGLLYHRYEVGADGLIKTAKIVPPTSQNQRTIEADLHDLVAANMQLDQDKLTWRCEQAIRNYDPCISCATHFLKLHVNERS